MKRKNLLYITAISFVALILLFGMQVYWLNLSNTFEQNELRLRVHKSAWEIAEQVEENALVSMDTSYLGAATEEDPNFQYSGTKIEYTEKQITDLVRKILTENKISQSWKFELSDPNGSVLKSAHKNFIGEQNSEEVLVPLFNSYQSSTQGYLKLQVDGKKPFESLALAIIVLIGLVILILLGTVFYFGYNKLKRELHYGEVTKAFVANMTHELKTPVSTIILATEVLQDKELRDTSAILDRYLGIIKQEASNLRDQIEMVLSFAHLNDGQLTYELNSIDMHQVLDQAIHHLDQRIIETGGSIERNYTANPARIKGDETHLVNIFNNILDNSFKYFKNTPKVIVSTTSEKHVLKISVQDNGIGIEKAVQSKIFENFYRVPTGDLHDVKGFGLGLSYVKKIVELANGSINILSAPNEGTKITISLPYNHGKQNENLIG